ncbi:copper chaperone PCu(A)C [Leucobacter albus]|uniref:Copper chaperone PCu(A)C n=1 Tax=Leucobacter albus TaxID=272210 RepID=A0ABW3TPQ5_9MICO
MLKNYTRATRFGVVLAAALIALTGCSGGAGGDTKSAQQTGAQAADSVTIEEAWVKSAGPGDMTAGFGVLENSSDTDVNVVSVSSAASPMMELHETVANESGQMVMREVEGGFVIPAGGKLVLEPAGNHIMLMDLPEAVTAGDDVTFTLTFADGSTLDFTAIVKDYAGANENYEGGHGEMSHGAEHGAEQGAASGEAADSAHDAHSGH